MAYFVEHSRNAVELIKKNLESLGVSEGFQILPKDVSAALRDFARQDIHPDFVFLDPPYRLRNAYRETLEQLARLNLSQRALIIAEHEKTFDPGGEFGSLRRTRLLKQGDAALSFYRSQAGSADTT